MPSGTSGSGALFLARDRFGIKPLYTAWVGERFYFASEVKALLPFLPDVRIDYRGLRDYLTFQFYLQGKTLFRDVRELPPATSCLVDARGERTTTYWQVHYEPDLDHTDALVLQSLPGTDGRLGPRRTWWPTCRWAAI